LVLAASYQP